MFGLSLTSIKLIAVALVLAGLFAGGMTLQHKLDDAKYTALELSYQQAETKAVAEAAARQKQIDDQALAAATAEDAQHQQLAATLQQELVNVPTHVTVKSIPCVSWGLIRVLDAAILGVNADTLALPAGKSDGSCSTFTAPVLAAAIIKNYGVAQQNAGQLDNLNALLKQMQATFGAKK